MMPIASEFTPGGRFFDTHDLVTLEHADFYPDGRDLGENYTYTSWRMSPCVQSGEMSCLHCHTSSGRFRFAEQPNDACLPCHQQRVENVVAHSKHEPGSEGSLCIRCHMPKTEFARMVRSDHSMRAPTPATTMKYESPNACNLCHKDHDAAWADRWVREWRTRDYQAPVLAWAALIQAAREGDYAQLDAMLAYVANPQRDEIVATSLIRLLQSCTDARKWPVMIKALGDRSPLVRAAAAGALDGYLTPGSARALLNATRDDFRLVRVRAAATLAALPAGALDEDDRRSLEHATREFLAAMSSRPDDSLGHYNLGNYHLEKGDLQQAIASYTTSHQLDRRSLLPLVNASMAYSLAGQNDRAEESLRKALQLQPQSVAANLNLGLLLGEMGRSEEAESALRRAFEVDPTSAVAAYNLAVLAAPRRLDEAIRWCRKAVALRPDDPRYAYTLAFYLHESGDAGGAIEVLQPLAQAGAPHGGIYALLGRLLEERSEPAAAAAVYRRAAENTALPDRERAGFAARMRAIQRP